MENNNPTTNSGHGNNFFSGFLFGVFVGAAIVFLFATKKGKKILKVISEEGLDKISDVLEKAKTADLDEVLDEEEEELPLVTEDKRNVKQPVNLLHREFAIQEKPKIRRFFRGVSRRVN